MYQVRAPSPIKFQWLHTDTSSPRCLHTEMRVDYSARCVLETGGHTCLEAIYLICEIIKADACIQMMFL